MAQIKPKHSNSSGANRTESDLTILARFEPKRMAQLDRNGWHKSNRYIQPQIINIIKGEMSIVGPRPHTVKKNEDLSSKVKSFMCRHMVKPGITGLAQAKGYRGEIKNEQDINFRLRYDLFYIKNWNVFLDFSIMLWTIKRILFKRENAN